MQHPPKKSSRKKHPWLLPALLTALLAAAAAVLLLLPGWKQQAVSSAMPDSPADRQKNLSQTDAATLLSLRVQQLNGEDYTLQYKDGSLWLEENTPISESVSAEMLEAVTLISTTDQVAADVEEVREHLTDMGLEPPQITVTATYSDGRTETLEIGGEVPETTYRYLRWSGDPGVYMGDIGIGEVFSMTRNRLIAVEQPEISTALVDTVQLENAAGTVSVRFTVDSAGYASAALTAPENYPMDAEKAQSLQSALNNFRLGTPEGMLTDETRAQYGLETPMAVLTLHQQAGYASRTNDEGQLVSEEISERNFVFTFGDFGSDYFYSCAYEGRVYQVSRLLTEALVQGSWESWCATRPADLGTAELRSIQIIRGSGVLEWQKTKTERVLANNQLETDTDGNVIYDEAVALNGEAAAAEQWDTLVDRLAALTVSGKIPADYSAEGKSPRWQIVLTTEGGTVRTIAAYPLDTFSDALMVDGVIRYYVHIEALDSVLGEFSGSLTD